MRKYIWMAGLAFAFQVQAQAPKTPSHPPKKVTPLEQKKVVYQVFTRLFGNTNSTNKPWGTKEENGVGKFNDFTDKALEEIKGLGVTHIWYTGVPHHAVVADYKPYGIADDDPDVVKGRAGSPYAVKDYYNVNPDLAVDPLTRLQEFEALIERTHKNGMKVIIDIVPNHIARKYKSLSKPEGVKDFGEDDDVSQEYNRNNNFYYIPGQPFQVPTSSDYKPLGGDEHPLLDGQFDENPAKWTGNGSRAAKPDINDWYETVKVNYGVRPDGAKDFPELPEGFEKKTYAEHYAYWKDKDVPNSWLKFREIALYWLEKGVDGFRYDMAEMVPYEFWSFLNSTIKMKNPEAFLLAEVYNPNEYRNYIFKGKMDYLYDKVETYDHLKAMIRGQALSDGLTDIRKRNQDIERHMLHFLDNHDEQRLASIDFAGTPERGKPLMVVSTLLSSAPIMIYFGQEVGEPGLEEGGFGKPTRTSIFDYVGVPHHQRWMNNGKFDGGQLSDNEKALRDFYKRLLTFSAKSSAVMGNYMDLHAANASTPNYDGQQYAFVRWSATEKLVVVSNFDSYREVDYTLQIPAELIRLWGLKDGSYPLKDVLYGSTATLKVSQGKGQLPVKLKGSESLVLKL
ncbi:alpha-amylase family glycosyl hydrolase [Flavobacterium sp.]|uniref:alpha-amylase family glycosyl hydrolase n=1 Tax=Flavobacterium sp. TaxID=239 RepID=UPI002610BA7D|nr:alpha-amylase family glycosyl hydrolase [Flavobacterium sp.]